MAACIYQFVECDKTFQFKQKTSSLSFHAENLKRQKKHITANTKCFNYLKRKKKKKKIQTPLSMKRSEIITKKKLKYALRGSSN